MSTVRPAAGSIPVDAAAAGEVVHDDLVEDAEHNMPGEDNVHFGVGSVHVFAAQRRRVPPEAFCQVQKDGSEKMPKYFSKMSCL